MKKLIPWIVLSIFIVFIFHRFFSFKEITAGDFPYFYKEQLKETFFPPSSWITSQRLGIPAVSPWIDTYVSGIIVVFVNTFHLPWNIVQNLYFFLFAVILSLCSSYYLFQSLFKKGSLFSSFIYTCNTYFLLVLGGGQAGILLAYSIAPLVLGTFINGVDLWNSNVSAKLKTQNSKLKITTQNLKFLRFSFIVGLVFTVQVMFDIRLAYITLAAAILYLVLRIKYKVSKENLLDSCFLLLNSIIIPLGITTLLHASWILPFVFTGSGSIDQLGGVYTTKGAVEFFSFAKFENTLSLLHPNWPENLFGKVYFMRWEFLILPILAFASLLFVGKTKSSSHQVKSHQAKRRLEDLKTLRLEDRQIILFFALLGLLGAFLAKGANDPFGQIYLWMFDHVPGFVMFRDPTKFYLLIALSYSILIPFSAFSSHQWFNSKLKSQKSKLQLKVQKFFSPVFFLLLTSYFLYLIHPACVGQLGGTFTSQSVPKEYVQLKEFLLTDQNFSRTLWIPYFQRFGVYTQQHPQVSGYQLFQGLSNPAVIKKLKDPSTEKLLQEAAIHYVVVPYDSEGEIFLNDRKYSEKEYKKVLTSIESVPYLTKRKEFGKIIVFEVKNQKGHFWSTSLRIQYEFINPTKYLVSVKGAKKGDRVVFSESYNTGWKAKQNNVFLAPSPYTLAPNIKLNSFVLSENGDYQLTISYLPQQLVIVGTVIQIVTIVCMGIFFIFFRKKM